MIVKEHGYYHLYCDECGHEEDEIFDSFEEAKDFCKTSPFWVIQKDLDEWLNLCEFCVDTTEITEIEIEKRRKDK